MRVGGGVWERRSGYAQGLDLYMKIKHQCEESGRMVTLIIDSSNVSLQSVRDLEKAVSRELYGTSQPLKLRYVPSAERLFWPWDFPR